jgi:hypothetical protein
MTSISHNPVLIIGGSGFVGSQAAATLRKLYPDLPIAIGGRDMTKAGAVASKLGRASPVAVDLARADLRQPDTARFSAVVLFVYDDSLNAMRYAQAHRLPCLSISTGIHEMAPEVALYAHHPAAAPVVMGSGWLAGAVALAARHFAGDFSAIDTIEITGLLDDQDLGGPAAEGDYVRLTALPQTLILDDGRWRWMPTGEQGRSLVSVDGRRLSALTYSPLDVVTLAAWTGARTVRFDFVLGETASRRRGEPFSTEVAIEIIGEPRDGGTRTRRYELVHPKGQAPVTALAVSLAVERLLGLADGQPAAPGFYFPETLIDADYAVRRFEEFGLQVSRPHS